MSVAAVHYLARDKRAVGVWLDGKKSYLPGYDSAESQGVRAMAQKPDNISFDTWALYLKSRPVNYVVWWETVQVQESESPTQILARLQKG